MENLLWAHDLESAQRCGAKEAVVSAGCCTMAENLPIGCIAVILELLIKGAAEKNYSDLKKAAEKCLASGSLPELPFDRADEETLAAILTEALAKEAALSRGERSFVKSCNCVTLGMAAYICARADIAVKTADVAVSMNLEAIRGELGAFDKRLHELGRPFPGQIETAENVRRITEGSQLTTDEGRYAYGYDKKPRVQDAICVRATPQTHGGARDIFHWCEEQVVKDWNSGAAELYRTEYAMNALATALADLAHISERRGFRLNDTRLSYGLPMNLVADELGINYGFPIVQSTQAAETAELKLLTLPTAAIKRTNSCHAYFAVSRLFELILKLNRVMAVEILMSAQALDIVHAKIPEFAFGAGTKAAYRRLREEIPMMVENRFTAPDMIAAEELTAGGEILKAAESAVGTLK